MKVVHSNTTMEEETPDIIYEEDCPMGEEIYTLQDAVLGLSEDVIEHEDVLHMLGEKIQVTETSQIKTLEVIDDLQEACKMMLDVVVSLNKEANRNVRIFGIIFVWLLVLTIWMGRTVL